MAVPRLTFTSWSNGVAGLPPRLWGLVNVASVESSFVFSLGTTHPPGRGLYGDCIFIFVHCRVGMIHVRSKPARAQVYPERIYFDVQQEQ